MRRVLTSVRIVYYVGKPLVFAIELTKYLARYQANPMDYEATIEKARLLKLKVEFGGGRKTKGGESPNAQIILNLKDLDS